MMRNVHRFERALALFLFSTSPIAALALDSTVETGLEVTGLVDLDSFGPLPPLSSQQRSVVTLPLAVSQIAVADAAPGVYNYLSSADIGLLELKITGSLINGAASPLGNGEISMMRVRSEVRDVLTLTSTLPDPYDVTFELNVDGAVTGSGSAQANAFIDFGLLGGSHGNDLGGYSFGSIDDTLSVTRQVSGATVDMDFTAWLNFSVTRVDPLSSVTGALDNTATMRLVLPAGVSLTSSASGTFGVPIPAVPEPGTWALMLSGTAVLGWLGRRRRLAAGMAAATAPA